MNPISLPPTPPPPTHESAPPPTAAQTYTLEPPIHRPPSLAGRILNAAQFLVALGVTCAVLAWLLFAPPPPPDEKKDERKPPSEVVQVVGPGTLRIEEGTPLQKKLEIRDVASITIKTPILTVTGRVAASLRPASSKNGKENKEGKELKVSSNLDGKKPNESDYWQFDSPEVLTAFTDWQKSLADISFAEKQLESIKKLDKQRVDSQKEVVDRLEKLFKIGDSALKELAAERNNLQQFIITGNKEVHEAETQVRIAQRTEAALARQLQQAGLEPEMLKAWTNDVDIVMADVPEGRVGNVRVGQSVEARFLGLGDELFTGKVERIAPTLSKERRSLRILFRINDPHDHLRPGMFAEIGLGTDPRQTVLVPTDAVLHVGRSDYVVIANGDGTWHTVEVKLGELHDREIEVLDGLRPGDRVIAKGAILLKPAVVLSLQPSARSVARNGNQP
jgi:hypothetical protein